MSEIEWKIEDGVTGKPLLCVKAAGGDWMPAASSDCSSYDLAAILRAAVEAERRSMEQQLRYCQQALLDLMRIAPEYDQEKARTWNQIHGRTFEAALHPNATAIRARGEG